LPVPGKVDSAIGGPGVGQRNVLRRGKHRNVGKQTSEAADWMGQASRPAGWLAAGAKDGDKPLFSGAAGRDISAGHGRPAERQTVIAGCRCEALDV
jgi:hypothetical protein